MVTLVPAGSDLATVAAALVNGVTGWLALHDLARLRSGEDVLVLGASGGLGGTVSRLAALHPAGRVIGVVGSESRRAQAAVECTNVLVAGELAAAVGRLTGGRGVDVTIDPVGGEARAEAFELLAPFGRLVVLGNASGDDPPLSGDAAWHGTRQVSGLSLGGVAHLVPERVGEALTALVQLLHRGVLREPRPTVAPLERAAEVHRALEQRSAPAKTVLATRAD
jgi:NADPH2:quinone reductase